jgi:hypothetical protein
VYERFFECGLFHRFFVLELSLELFLEIALAAAMAVRAIFEKIWSSGG